MTNVTKSIWKKRTTGALFVLWVSLFAFRALAAESSTAPDTEPAPANAEQARSPAQGSRQPPDKSGESSDDFKPSEEISEDYAVSFPVDI